ncbi:MAG: restriction endonuclease subunit S [Candidatus Thiodiazotropha sp.]
MSSIDTGLHYPIELENLPESWVYGLVGEFCDIVQSGFACGKHSDDDIGVTHLRPMNVNRAGEIDLTVQKYIPTSYDNRRLTTGNVLFNNTNSPELIGKTAYVTNEADGLAFSNHMTRIEFKNGIDSKYGAYQLHYLWMARYYMHKCIKHVNQASISSSDFSKSIPFVVPPTNEQHRIVAKIEELFSELDKGIESLKRAREQLKVYRQALLKHAFEGELTEQWRKDNADKLETADQLLARIKQAREDRYQKQLKEWKEVVKQWEKAGEKGKKPRKPIALHAIKPNEGQVPHEWLSLQVRDCLISSPSNGRSVKDRDGGFPVLRLTALKGEKICISERKNGDWDREQAKEYIIKEGDFLLSRGNGSKSLVGLGKLVPSTKIEVAYPDTMVRLKPNTDYLRSEYLAEVWNSRVIRNQIEEAARTTAGIYKINQKHINEFVLPICSLEEQDWIIRRLNEVLPVINQMMKEIEAGLERSEALRQSILKKAFSGQLVAQDPNDEPASVLLERIAAEKAQAAARGKKPRASKKKPVMKKAG